MPELPEVHTTATELNKLLKGKKIVAIWNSYKSTYYKGKLQIKNPAYFKKFKKEVVGKKIVGVRRRAKNVLIDIEGPKTILVHMKMTGHLLYGKFKLVSRTSSVIPAQAGILKTPACAGVTRGDSEVTSKEEWVPDQKGPLNDKMNGWIRLVFTLSNGKHLALSDMRKFAKVTLENDFETLGPEPLEKEFNFDIFKEQIFKKSNGKIKTVLMNQELIAGIGNIYSDEALWLSKINPEREVKKIKETELKELFKNIKKVLKKGINLSGDSMSDYRRPDGSPGEFQNHHNVYQRKKMECKRKTCKGIIERKVVNGRSAHYCPVCQK